MGVGFRLKQFRRVVRVSASSPDKREHLRDALSLADCSRLLWLALFVCLGLVAGTPDARAQIPEMNRGFAPNSAFATSGIDTVNLFNGNLIVSIPLGPNYPIGADFSHQLRLVYNSQLWRSAYACSPDADRDFFGVYAAGSPLVGAGWTLEMGHLQEPEPDGPGAFSYFAPDGSVHPFAGPTGGVYRTDNRSYLRARNVQSTGGLLTNAELDFPNGERGYFTRRIAVAHGSTRNDFNADGLYLTRLENRFGDALEVNYDLNYEVADGTWRIANIKHYSQGVLLRQITFHYTLVTVNVGPDTWAVVSSIDFPSVSGTQRVLLNYSLTGFGRPGRDITDLACLNPAERSRTLTAAPLLASVQLDATQPALTYSFDYFRQIDPRPGNNAGVMTQLVLPAGGGVRYQWGFFPAGALEPLTPYCNPADRGCRLRFRRENMVPLTQRTEYPEGFGGPAHIWRYRQTRFIWPPPFSQRTEVEAPDGYKVQHFFHIEPNEYANLPSNGLEYQTDSLDAAGNPIRRSRFCYESDQYGSNLCGPSVDFFWLGGNVRQSYTDVTAIGSPSQTKKVQRSFWDGFGHFGREDFYDWDGVTLRRSVITQWNPNTADWLLNLFDSRSEIEGTRVDRYFYLDRGTGFLKTSLIGDPSPPSRIHGTCRYSDGAGNAVQEVSAIAEFALPPPVDPCPATFAAWPGGVIGLNNDAFGKQNAYQHGLLTSSRWIQDRSPIGWALINQARDFATGLVTTSWDTSGVPTTFGYDILGRVTSVAPSEEAASLISYDSPTQTTVTRSGADGNSTWERSLYDGFGRLTREIRQMPSGFSVRLRRYDSVGRPFFLSEWAGCGDPASCAAVISIPGTTSSNFDPFGRPQAMTRADGSTTAISYADGSVPFSDTQKTLTVNNVNGTCGGGSCVGGVSAATTYRYDVFGRVASVTEPDGSPTTYAYDVSDRLTFASQPPSQTRSFSYDPFGFLRSETTPEKGTVTYSSYGSLGNLLQKTEGGILHTYSYDAAGRLLSEFAGGTQYVANFYDAGGFTGKLTRRVGSNPLSSPPGTVTEDFAYSGTGGRLSQKTVNVTGAPALVPAAIQTWSYNTLGLLADHGHPRVGGLPDILSRLTYSNGLPVGLVVNGQPVVSAASYNPSGGLASWTAGNGIVTTTAQDPSLLPRPLSISTSLGGFSTGTYTYDGAGNIRFMGDDSFSYDVLSRLTSSIVSGQTRSYPYDRYGNLNPAIINPANNRLLAGSYDGMGNLTAFAGKSYAYDALSRQTSLDSGAERYLYDGASERIAKMALLPPPNDADFISQSVPTTMITGQTYSVSITMRNAGTNTWEERPPPYPPFPHRLGTLYSGIWGLTGSS